jgi:hypothetical protein
MCIVQRVSNLLHALMLLTAHYTRCFLAVACAVCEVCSAWCSYNEYLHLISRIWCIATLTSLLVCTSYGASTYTIVQPYCSALWLKATLKHTVSPLLCSACTQLLLLVVQQLLLSVSVCFSKYALEALKDATHWQCKQCNTYYCCNYTDNLSCYSKIN